MKRYGGLGGIPGGRKINKTDAFEMAVARSLDLSDHSLAVELWSSLANVDWEHDGGDTASYSFRAAGDLIAAVKADGSDYMEWYCCGPDATVSERVADALASQGWRPVKTEAA